MINTRELENLLQNDDPRAVNNPSDVRQRLFAIEKIEEEIEDLKELKREARDFYNDRIQSKEETIDLLKAQIEGFMSATGRSTLPTEIGTVSLQERTRPKWPEEEDLLRWCEKKGLVKTAMKRATKREIKQFIENTNETPDGYEEETYTTLSIRIRSVDRSEENSEEDNLPF